MVSNEPSVDMKNSLSSRFFLTPFGALNCTQFLGAMNDNIFKLLTVFCFIFLEGPAASNSILASVGAIYVLPFLLLSSMAGTMADRFSKKTIILGAKIAESCVMALGLLAFGIGSKVLAFAALFLLACHSAIFAPCKYGIVPEIVPTEKISKANGLLTSCTYIAIIIGTFLASFLTEISNHNFIIASMATLGFSFIGLYTAWKIPRTAPSGSQKKISLFFLTELYRNMILIYKQPSLLSAVLGSAFFLFVGSYTQLNMIPFAFHTLHLTDVQGGYLFLLTALGIGCGSLLAGKLSGPRIELGFVPIGGFGIAICFVLLSLFSHSLVPAITYVFLIGVFGGLYLVPLDSYIQFASPNLFRGQVIATGNFLGFFGVLCSAGMLYFLSEIVEMDPATGFLTMGILTFCIVSGITIAISGHVIRFFCELATRLFFRIPLRGRRLIPTQSPSCIISALSYWPWAIILVGSQSRRMQLFAIEESARPYKVMLWRLMGMRLIAPDEMYVYDTHIAQAVERGTSIAIFCPQEYVQEFYEYWKQEEESLVFFCLQKQEADRLPQVAPFQPSDELKSS